MTHDYGLSIHTFIDFKNSYDFVTEAVKYKMPSIGYLKFSQLDEASEEYLDCLHTFITESCEKPIKTLCLGGGYYSSISIIEKGVPQILPRITDRVLIVCFTVNDQQLIDILEGSRNCSSLVLQDLYLEEMSDKFSINSEYEYNLTELALPYTAYSPDGDDDKLVTVSFHILSHLIKSSILL